MLFGKWKILYDRLESSIASERMLHDSLYTLAYGTDASFYRLVPKLVILAKDEREVSLIFRECADLQLPVTVRAAGTSLSGQAVTDSVLLVAGSSWNSYSIGNNGSTITLQPGITGGKANAILAPFGRKIGPDPASVNSAMIGGIAANNASGMCCGTAANSYRTVDGMRIVFADGSVLDTRDTQSRTEFAASHRGLLASMAALAREVKENSVLSARIRKKYKMKNTTGYSLNALTDFTDPFDILEHLMIGSEGTLGFISGITYSTVVEHPHKASSLMVFPDIRAACNAVAILKSQPVSAVELIDRAGLRSVETEKAMAGILSYLQDETCALLVETVAAEASVLEHNIKCIRDALNRVHPSLEVNFTGIPAEYEQLWKIRKGLFPSVGAMRRTGTTVIIEDVAFQVENLAEATTDLQTILKKWGYDEAVIFGHALEGNLHFVFTQDFNEQEEITRYSNLMNDISELVVNKYDGSLKAEHGTGRNMAPFVELEWGTEAYRIMKQIKQAFDPLNILNPGVVLNADPRIHLKDLKSITPADEIIDKCTECGFCETSCVSAGLTLTPRQRIVVQRELANLRRQGTQPHIAASLANSFLYSGHETCATDGLCAMNCPVKIDTGKFIKHWRTENSATSVAAARFIASHFAFVTGLARAGLTTVNFFSLLTGKKLMKLFTGSLRKISRNTIPLWNPFMPSGARKTWKSRISGNGNRLRAVYFPSCINRSMGTSPDYYGEVQLSMKMVSLLDKAGYDVVYPENLDKLCCGMAFSSKGYAAAGKQKSDELEAALLKASNNGQLPVLCDMSPCLYTMKENMSGRMKLYEPVEFILEYLLPNLELTRTDKAIAVFPVCSMKKMGLESRLVELARLCSTNVSVPETNCCGFAGDRGFTFPELNKHGLRELTSQLPAGTSHGYSTSRTCEIGLSLYSGISYRSIVYLVDEASRPKQQ